MEVFLGKMMGMWKEKMKEIEIRRNFICFFIYFISCIYFKEWLLISISRDVVLNQDLTFNISKYFEKVENIKTSGNLL